MNENKLRRILQDYADAVASAHNRRDMEDALIADRVRRDVITMETAMKQHSEARYQMVEDIGNAEFYAVYRISAMADDVILSGIAIDGYDGTWHVVDARNINRQTLLLLEHDRYGDETGCLIVTEKTHKVILDDVWNGWEDYEEAFCD